MIVCDKKMASKRKSSPLWNHFEQTEPKKAKCLYCSKVLAMSSSSIGSLSRHIKQIHSTINISMNRLEPVQEVSSADVSEVVVVQAPQI